MALLDFLMRKSKESMEQFLSLIRASDFLRLDV